MSVSARAIKWQYSGYTAHPIRWELSFRNGWMEIGQEADMKAKLRNDKPIELGRPSNVGSLIAAVCVGLFALVSNQYARVCAQMLQQFLNQQQVEAQVEPSPETVEVTAVTPETAPPKQVKFLDTPAKIDRSLELLSPTVETLFQRWRSRLDASTKNHGGLRELQRVYQGLDRKPELVRQLSTPSRLTLLSVTFMAYQVAPQDFRQRYVSWSKVLSESQEPIERALAEGLSIYTRNDMKRPNVPHLCDTLRKFTETHQNYKISADVYVMIAQELWLRGQLKASETILRSGMETLSGRYERDLLSQELMKQQQSLPTLRRHSF